MQLPAEILYADDDEDDRYFFQLAVNKLSVDYKVRVFENGMLLETALAEQEHRCDFVFLDINMPVKNGLQVLNSLQKAIQSTTLRVIILSTSGDEDLVKKAFNLNAVLYVQKPVRFEDWIIMLETVLTNKNDYKLPRAFNLFTYKFTRA